jgi:pimeloyl-ACP methyl ester carboxylesterase
VSDRSSDAAGELPFHRAEGQGPALVLLNGVSMTLGAWEPVRRVLDARYRVVRCDLRGQLRTPGPPPASLEGHLTDLRRLLDHLEIDRAHLVGTSFGAVLAMLFAERHPRRTRSLVLATVGPGRRPAALETIRRWSAACEAVLAGDDREAFYRAMARDLFSESTRRDHPERVERLGRQIRRLPERWFRDLLGLLAAASEADLQPHLPSVTHAALVVAAAEDALVPPDDAARLAHALPAARLELVPRAGHALILERPRRFAELCLQFLERHPG